MSEERRQAVLQPTEAESEEPSQKEGPPRERLPRPSRNPLEVEQEEAETAPKRTAPPNGPVAPRLPRPSREPASEGPSAAPEDEGDDWVDALRARRSEAQLLPTEAPPDVRELRKATREKRHRRSSGKHSPSTSSGSALARLLGKMPLMGRWFRG